jgi:hypothetical protein
MALSEDVVGGGNKDIWDDSTSRVSLSTNDLVVVVDELIVLLCLAKTSCLGLLLVRGKSTRASMRACLGSLSLLNLLSWCSTR